VRPRLPDWKLVSLTAAVATIASLTLAVSTPASMNVDGQRVLSDVAPVTTPGQAYLPIRAISDAAGAITTFDPATGEILVERGSDRLKMKLGDIHATLDGRPIVLTHAPFAVRGRTMVPSTAIAAAFGSSVKYDARRGRVEVRTPGVVVAGAPDDTP
jgi:hypothetical protein